MFERQVHRASTFSWVVIVLLTAWSARAQGVDKARCVATHEGAQRARIEGRLLEARAELQRCTEASCPRVLRDDCNALLSDLERSLPTVQFAVQDEVGAQLEDVRVEVDGRPLPVPVSGPPIPIDPGVHTLRFLAGGRAPSELQVTIYQGEKGRVLEVRLAPVEPSAPSAMEPPREPERDDTTQRSKRWLVTSYALASSAVAAFVVTGAAALRGSQMQQRCEDEGCSDGYAERGKRLYRTVNGSAIAGGVLAAAALGTFWSGRVALRKERVATVSGAVSTNGATLLVSHRF